MHKLTIICPVLVKVKITEGYKQKLSTGIQQAIRQIDVQMQHLEFQARRVVAELEKQNPQGVPAARKQIEQERARRLEARQKLLDKLKEVARLNPGEEVVHGQLQSLVELKVGDNFQETTGMEVVLEDGVVIDIRPTGGNALDG
ncbi:F0F1-type ATP synthase membrane subunit b/b' [Desulfofundulus luciae]|uniref:F0F1-type ATP synthase membrane subunit b/b n=1 Tax=Desulfofundulus luciae TaxID=74702 RepID=A0ABU0B5N8_9FIRM|nr:YlqD family protein [Desulfofundulus luciae]MDQ0287589.1 F0F1-type ATP synthase membrane subunit b/b' [Desulfofundulus luciae]